MSKPLVGLTPTPELLKMQHGTFRRHTLSEHYSKAVAAAGGIPVMLPSNYEDAQDMLDRMDALIITGGGDIDPTVYGQAPHDKTDDIDSERDAFEQALAISAFERDMPLLGICRGLQLINVALGGTLLQDVADLHPHAVEHRQQDLGIDAEQVFQSVTISNGNHPLQHMASDAKMEVNSFHHQGIDRLAGDLEPIAFAQDGLIEAAWNPEKLFVLAVQWHPELLAEHYDDHAAIFRSLIAAAQTYQSAVALIGEHA